MTRDAIRQRYDTIQLHIYDVEIPGPNRKTALNKHPVGDVDANANDILKHKQLRVSYQPEDDEDLYGSAEDLDNSYLPPIPPLTPHVHYATVNEGNAGGGGNNAGVSLATAVNPNHKQAANKADGMGGYRHHYNAIGIGVDGEPVANLAGGNTGGTGKVGSNDNAPNTLSETATSLSGSINSNSNAAILKPPFYNEIHLPRGINSDSDSNSDSGGGGADVGGGGVGLGITMADNEINMLGSWRKRMQIVAVSPMRFYLASWHSCWSWSMSWYWCWCRCWQYFLIFLLLHIFMALCYGSLL